MAGGVNGGPIERYRWLVGAAAGAGAGWFFAIAGGFEPIVGIIGGSLLGWRAAR